MKNMITSISKQNDIPLEQSKKEKTRHVYDSAVCSTKNSDLLLIAVLLFNQMLNLDVIDAKQ